MALAELKFVEAPSAPVAVAPPPPVPTLPRSAQMAAFLAVAQTGTFSAAAVQLGVAQPTVSKRVRALERLLGTPLVDRTGGGLTSSGRDAARTIRLHLNALATELGAIRQQQPSLTVALPGGRVGEALAPLLEAHRNANLGPLCFVPGWSSAALTFRTRPGEGDCEDVYLFADEWAAVAGPGWQGGGDLVTKDMLQLPLVAVTPEEHEAWHMILENEAPTRLLRASRAEADALVAKGEALGVANVPLLPGLACLGLTPVSRRHVWPGTGLWVSLQNGSPAWDRGWDLATALKAAFEPETNGK